jgi:hypothetical protein
MANSPKKCNYLAVMASLVRSGDVYHWRVEACPFCQSAHFHRGGPITKEPRQWLILQHALCGVKATATLDAAAALSCSDQYYLIVDRDPSLTLALIASTLSELAEKREAERCGCGPADERLLGELAVESYIRGVRR